MVEPCANGRQPFHAVIEGAVVQKSLKSEPHGPVAAQGAKSMIE